jgi:hypothetical protein
MKAKPERPAPRGPIRERTTGRLLAMDDQDDVESASIEFDDPATSAPRDEKDDE